MFQKSLRSINGYTNNTCCCYCLSVSVICVDNLDNMFLSGHFNSSMSALCSTVYLGISVSSDAKTINKLGMLDTFWCSKCNKKQNDTQIKHINRLNNSLWSSLIPSFCFSFALIWFLARKSVETFTATENRDRISNGVNTDFFIGLIRQRNKTDSERVAVKKTSLKRKRREREGGKWGRATFGRERWGGRERDGKMRERKLCRKH